MVGILGGRVLVVEFSICCGIPKMDRVEILVAMMFDLL